MEKSESTLNQNLPSDDAVNKMAYLSLIEIEKKWASVLSLNKRLIELEGIQHWISSNSIFSHKI